MYSYGMSKENKNSKNREKFRTKIQYLRRKIYIAQKSISELQDWSLEFIQSEEERESWLK